VSLIVKLTETGNPGTNGRDKLTLKVEAESPLIIQRQPIIIPLPGGSIVGIDLGRNAAIMSISGVVDAELKELFVDNKAGSPFQVGETITGTSGWNTLTSPTRSATPTATVVAGSPNLTSPTSLIVSGLSSLTEFFVDNETITGGTSGGTASVNEPLPTKRRLEHVARFWYNTGKVTLTTASGVYVGYINSMDFSMEAGLEDRYKFRIDFAEAEQGLTAPV
jgi:hypothetical protein